MSGCYLHSLNNVITTSLPIERFTIVDSKFDGIGAYIVQTNATVASFKGVEINGKGMMEVPIIDLWLSRLDDIFMEDCTI